MDTRQEAHAIVDSIERDITRQRAMDPVLQVFLIARLDELRKLLSSLLA